MMRMLREGDGEGIRICERVFDISCYGFFFNKGKCVNLNSRFVNKKSQICQNNTVEKLIEKSDTKISRLKYHSQ